MNTQIENTATVSETDTVLNEVSWAGKDDFLAQDTEVKEALAESIGLTVSEIEAMNDEEITAYIDDQAAEHLAAIQEATNSEATHSPRILPDLTKAGEVTNTSPLDKMPSRLHNLPPPDGIFNWENKSDAMNTAATIFTSTFEPATRYAVNGMHQVAQWALSLFWAPADKVIVPRATPEIFVKGALEMFRDAAVERELPHNYGKMDAKSQKRVKAEIVNRFNRSTAGQYAKPGIQFAALVAFDPVIPNGSGYWGAQQVLGGERDGKGYGACLALSTDKGKSVFKRHANEMWDLYHERAVSELKGGKPMTVIAVPANVIKPCVTLKEFEIEGAKAAGATFLKADSNVIVSKNADLVIPTLSEIGSLVREAFDGKIRDIEGKVKREAAPTNTAGEQGKKPETAMNKEQAIAFASSVDNALKSGEMRPEMVVNVFDYATQLLKNEQVMLFLLKKDATLRDTLADLVNLADKYSEEEKAA